MTKYHREMFVDSWMGAPTVRAILPLILCLGPPPVMDCNLSKLPGSQSPPFFYKVSSTTTITV